MSSPTTVAVARNDSAWHAYLDNIVNVSATWTATLQVTRCACFVRACDIAAHIVWPQRCPIAAVSVTYCEMHHQMYLKHTSPPRRHRLLLLQESFMLVEPDMRKYGCDYFAFGSDRLPLDASKGGLTGYPPYIWGINRYGCARMCAHTGTSHA